MECSEARPFYELRPAADEKNIFQHLVQSCQLWDHLAQLASEPNGYISVSTADTEKRKLTSLSILPEKW